MASRNFGNPEVDPPDEVAISKDLVLGNDLDVDRTHDHEQLALEDRLQSWVGQPNGVACALDTVAHGRGGEFEFERSERDPPGA